MLVFVDDRPSVRTAYLAGFRRESISATGFVFDECREWLTTVAPADLDAIEGFLLGDGPTREKLSRTIRDRSTAPIIALNECSSLDRVLELFAAGVDDVVRKPVHIRELLGRIGAIRRRSQQKCVDLGDLRVFFDGRDPQIRGTTFPLPPRERRILECLVDHRGKRVNKSQLFHSLYGLFDDIANEAIIETHVSRLRKKLRHCLGHDPIDTRRYLGYCFQ